MSSQALRPRVGSIQPAAMTRQPALEITNLTIELPAGADRPYAVKDLSILIHPGEVTCIVGESGSGKSMAALATMRLLPKLVKATSGRVILEGRDLLSISNTEMRAVRGREIGMIFQEPLTALDPVMRVGKQIEEVLEVHGVGSKAQRVLRALELITEVGLPDPEKIVKAYPHQMSGGQRQRVMIAMALALEPKLLIADEPTTALDVTTQAQILKLIAQLRQKHDMAVMFITHDFGVVSDIADRVIVMRHGECVEEGYGSGSSEKSEACLYKAASGRCADDGSPPEPRTSIADVDAIVIKRTHEDLRRPTFLFAEENGPGCAKR